MHNLDEPCNCGYVDVDNLNLCKNEKVAWTPFYLDEISPGSLTWIGHMDPPTDGRWTAFFVNLQFEETQPRMKSKGLWPFGDVGTFDFTTSVSIVPATFPFPDCHGDQCLGTIL